MPSSPLSPSNLSLSPVSKSQINLTWNDNDWYTNGIQIQRRVYGDPFYQTIDTVGGGDESYQDTSCDANVHYQYRVYPPGNDEFGNPYAPTDPEDAWSYPGTITDLTATKVDDEPSVDLEWTNDGTYTKIRIYYKKTADSSWSYTDVTFDTGARVEGLDEGVSYDFKVAAYETLSSLIGVVTSPDTAITDIYPPTDLVLTAPANTTIRLTWTDNSSFETGVEIYRDDVLAHTTAADAETWDDTGRTPGVEYTYKIRAKTASYYSSFTEEASLTAGVPPAAPTLDAVTKVDHDSIKVDWTPGDTEETGFEIWQSEDDVTYALVHTTAAAAVTYTVTGLDADTLYYYKVRAVNLSGNSAFTTADSATTDEYIQAPTDLTLEVLSDTQIKLTWTNNSETVDTHRIERKIEGGSYAEIGYTNAGTDTYTDATCSPETKYYYRVRDKYGSNYGSYCTEDDATTLSSGTASTRRNETYFAMGSEVCQQVDEIQGARTIDSLVETKDMDFTDQDPEAHNRWKTLALIVLEYEDKSADTPVTVSVSTDGGTTWTDKSLTLGDGDGTQKSAEFRFVPITSKYFRFKVRCNDNDTDFSWTALYAYYDLGGPYYEVE